MVPAPAASGSVCPLIGRARSREHALLQRALELVAHESRGACPCSTTFRVGVRPPACLLAHPKRRSRRRAARLHCPLLLSTRSRSRRQRRSGAYRDRYNGCEEPHTGARRAADSSCEARALLPMRRDKWLLRAATSAVPAARIWRSASYGTSAAARDSMLLARMLRPDFATVNTASTAGVQWGALCCCNTLRYIAACCAACRRSSEL